MLKSGWLGAGRVVRGLRNAIVRFVGKSGTNRQWRRINPRIISKAEIELVRRIYGQSGVDACMDIHNTSINPCPLCHRSGCILIDSRVRDDNVYFRCDLCGYEWKKSWDI
jgi:DNA-directed RNA polymerase subunit M/transcription elongation factor TFIIS